MVARAVAEQQLRQARVAETAFQRGQLLGRGGACQRKQRFVAVAEETVVQRGIDVGHGGDAGLVVDLARLLGSCGANARSRSTLASIAATSRPRRAWSSARRWFQAISAGTCSDALPSAAPAPRLRAARWRAGKGAVRSPRPQFQQVVDVTVQVEHDHPLLMVGCTASGSTGAAHRRLAG